jgi:hypothetical protein
MPIFLLMCKLAGAHDIKHFFSSSLTVQQNKLVCLTLTLFKHASYVRVKVHLHWSNFARDFALSLHI